MSIFAGLFSHYQPLRGSGWLHNLPALDRKVFSDVGRASMRSPETFQSEGGRARAATAKRDARGRFVKEVRSEQAD